MDIQTIQERTANLKVRIAEITTVIQLRHPWVTLIRTRRKSSTTAQLLIGGYHYYFLWSDNYWVSVRKRGHNHDSFETPEDEDPWGLSAWNWGSDRD